MDYYIILHNKYIISHNKLRPAGNFLLYHHETDTGYRSLFSINTNRELTQYLGFR